MRNILYVSSGIAGVVTAALLASGIFLNSGVASAAEPFTIAGDEIGRENVLSIKSLQVKEVKSEDSNVDLKVEKKDDFTVILRADNNGNKDAELNIDSWKIVVSGALVNIAPEATPVEPLDSKISAKDSKVLAEFDFATLFPNSQDHVFYPGKYELSFYGFNANHSMELQAIEDDIPQEEEQEPNDFLSLVKAKADVFVGFDETKIKNKESRIITATNVQATLTGDSSNPFEITSDGRTLTVLATNNNPYPVSGQVYSVSFTLYNAETMTAVGSDRIYETIVCANILEPGESITVATLPLDTDSGMLGDPDGKSLAKKMGDTKVKPGTYIVAISGNTLPCQLEGEDLPSLWFDSVVAFEVKQ